ncbi:hypothetical protein ACJJIK_10835 [Microbulbifer sp. ZKSA006]|uniref:hypothetical protein n=1 Tax=Microbulbifer sp. ZKSA006 TaxID=3243390 RepID=UPI004039ADE5
MNMTAETKLNNEAVNRFAIRMKETLIRAQLKGRAGWYDPEVCSEQDLLAELRKQLRKSPPSSWVDVANVCMMLHERRASGSTLEPSPPSGNITKFLSAADELENHYPFLYVEIARTRTTDWMAWLKEKPNAASSLATGQGDTAEEACERALDNLSETPKE